MLEFKQHSFVFELGTQFLFSCLFYVIVLFFSLFTAFTTKAKD